MTVQNTIVKNVYVGNGSTTIFPFTFECNKAEHIQAFVKDAAGNISSTTNFKVDLEQKNLTYPNTGEPLAKGDKLIILRQLPLQQLLNLLNQGPFYAEDIEETFDEVVMMLQQMTERIGRSLAVSVDIDAENSFNTIIPLEAGKTFRVKDDGTGFEVTEDPGKVIDGAKALLKQTMEQAELAKEQAAASSQSAISAQNAAAEAETSASSVRKYKALWFDSVAAMKAEPSLTAGAYVCTAGYYAPNDGGSASYLIRAKADSDVDDGGSLHQLSNGLVAELIVENGTVYPEQFGVNENNGDIGSLLNSLIDKGFTNFQLKDVNYICETGITLYNRQNVTISGQGGIVDTSDLSRKRTVIKFSNCNDPIAINMAGSQYCTIKNINIIGGAEQTVGIYMDTTSETQYSQYNILENVFVRVLEKHSCNNNEGSIALYNVEGELATFRDCVFVGCRPIYFSLDDEAGIRNIGGGQKSEHTSCTFFAFDGKILAISFGGKACVTINGSHDINFDTIYTQFSGYGEENISDDNPCDFLLSPSERYGPVANINISMHLGEHHNVPENKAGFMRIKGNGNIFFVSAKSNCIHECAYALKVEGNQTVNMAHCKIRVYGLGVEGFDLTNIGSASCNEFECSNVPSIMNNGFGNIIKGVSSSNVTATSGDLYQTIIIPGDNSSLIKIFGINFIGTYGVPSKTNIPNGTIAWNFMARDSKTTPLLYIYRNEQWETLVNQNN